MYNVLLHVIRNQRFFIHFHVVYQVIVRYIQNLLPKPNYLHFILQLNAILIVQKPLFKLFIIKNFIFMKFTNILNNIKVILI